MFFQKDIFLQKFIKKNCYISKYKKVLNFLYKLKTPYFLTYVSKKKLTKKEQKIFNCKYSSKLIIFKKIFNKKENVYNRCRAANKKDKTNLEKIVNKTKTYSRFSDDKKISRKSIKEFRKEWVLGYFIKKINRKLIVCEIDKKIAGFVLLKDFTKYLRIELIMVDPNFQHKGVGSSLISHINNIYLGSRHHLKAGTQFSNKQAIKFYKKSKFDKIGELFYQHIYSNTLKNEKILNVKL